MNIEKPMDIKTMMSDNSKLTLVLIFLLGIGMGTLTGVTGYYFIGDWIETPGREKARRISCRGNLKQVAVALLIYADGREGALPSSLAALKRSTELPSGSVKCPSVESKGTDYRYFGKGLKLKEVNPNAVIACDEKKNHNDYINILYPDGRAIGVHGVDSINECVQMFNVCYPTEMD